MDASEIYGHNDSCMKKLENFQRSFYIEYNDLLGNRHYTLHLTMEENDWILASISNWKL